MKISPTPAQSAMSGATNQIHDTPGVSQTKAMGTVRISVEVIEV